MPWKVHSLLEARQRFVRQVLRRAQSIAQCCRQFGISRKTGFKWLRRFRQESGLGLQERSHRPVHSARRTAPKWLRAITQLRLKHSHWGAKKIYARLRKEHPRACLPKVRTIAKWLPRLVKMRQRPARARRGPQLPRPPLTIPQGPNDVWTVDFKGWFRTADGRRVDPLTVRDLFSRYLLGIKLLRHQHEPVKQYFERLFIRYGLPKVIRVDHGPPFAGDGALDLSRLSAWWLRLSIRVEFTRRASPQDNAAHEQMHGVYKAELASPPARTPRGQQRRTNHWTDYYNYERPHEALGQQVPAVFYRKSRRTYRLFMPELTYPKNWPMRRVSPSGYIRWQGRGRVIGRAFAQECVGFKCLGKGTHEIYFGRHLIGLLVDTDPGGLRPAQWSTAIIAQAKPSPISMP
jgi:putative transposase